jgi:hypothetical protein
MMPYIAKEELDRLSVADITMKQGRLVGLSLSNTLALRESEWCECGFTHGCTGGLPLAIVRGMLRRYVRLDDENLR